MHMVVRTLFRARVEPTNWCGEDGGREDRTGGERGVVVMGKTWGVCDRDRANQDVWIKQRANLPAPHIPTQMDDTDSSWCGVCDRQIVPKRILVPVTQDPPPSPQHDSPRRNKTGTIRQRSGLVHGTGRVRPNGTLKAAPVKTRVEIDQSPAPLYCSDECRQKDLEFFHGRPVYSDSASSDTSDDDTALRTARHTCHQHERSTPNTRSLAVFAREYGIAPLPPSTCETYDELHPRVKATPYRPPEFTSGVMMANRRLDAVLPKPLKAGERPPVLKPVPGWTDGSQAWRASTYSFAPPPQSRADVLDPNRAAYQSFVASPHRSAQSGVTVTDAYASSPTSPTTASSSSAHSELRSSYDDAMSRRTSSRLSLASSPASSTMSASPPRKSRAQLAAASLLVPDVLLNPPQRVPSTESLSSLNPAVGRTGRRHSAGSFGAQRRVRSPLSTSGSVVSSNSDDEDAVEPEDAEEAAYVAQCPPQARPPRRPHIETRSWSYDNVRTYPVMKMPPLKELRVVDGVEREVEVEQPRKCLFTFADVPLRA
ncbi:hypothetical protein DFH06DRAFT_1434948 [Mycena polygramma]|nr:hypothetical protein DFH06DRAFT_1434948 [Mycena polygramma]